MIDLHVHSACSDGTFTPKELVEYALSHNITAFSLTDHDTVAGLDEAISHAHFLSGNVCHENPEGKLLEVIPGIEFSTEYEKRDIHIIGLFMDYRSELFQKNLCAFVDSREDRNRKMCSLLAKHGISITYEELLKTFPNAIITRAHYARYLLDKGYVKSISEAFDRYVGDHASCFVPREKVTPFQAVTLIRATGGIPVLAHPTLYHMSKERLEGLILALKEVGLLAIEGIYSSYSISETRQMHTLATKCGLLISGGSDFHGENKPGLCFGTGYGKLYIHEDLLEKLRNRIPSLRSSIY